ncbi:MAG: N-formylglutamate amidohydrolase [Actinobacteria bacterium]|nr:N-formylglutamate amidohydrolase [Actinomycetota bacterium]
MVGGPPGYSFSMWTQEPVALWTGREAESNVIAVAVHAGHGLREEIARLMTLPESDRRREEDAGTDRWAMRFPSHLVAARSRFEIDLNRPREDAVYVRPEDCWDLQIWRRPPTPDVVGRSRAAHDAFYGVLAGILDRAQDDFGRFVVYDLHSYNHRRTGPAGPPGDQAGHPDVNVGTGSMDRGRWGPLVDRFIAELRSVDIPYGDGHLDVRENVKFYGRQLARWVHDRYPATGCALAIEVKKFYMDEHTGRIDQRLYDAVGDALEATASGMVDELDRLPR